MEVTIQIQDTRHKYLANGKVWLHAVSEGQIVGSVSLDGIGDGDWAWINDLYVPEPLRRKQIGRRLLVQAIQSAPALASVGCCAGVNRYNAVSCNLFESLGFMHCYGWDETRVYTRRFPRDPRPF